MGKGTTDFGANYALLDLDKHKSLRAKHERKVIEAARKWALVAAYGDAEDFEKPLLAAVRALDAAEKGGE